jgi:hypothetical protein
MTTASISISRVDSKGFAFGLSPALIKDAVETRTGYEFSLEGPARRYGRNVAKAGNVLIIWSETDDGPIADAIIWRVFDSETEEHITWFAAMEHLSWLEGEKIKKFASSVADDHGMVMTPWINDALTCKIMWMRDHISGEDLKVVIIGDSANLEKLDLQTRLDIKETKKLRRVK